MGSNGQRRFFLLLIFSVLIIPLTAAPVACGPTGEKEDVAERAEAAAPQQGFLADLPPVRVNLVIRRGEGDIYVHPDSVKVCKKTDAKRNPTCPRELLWMVRAGGLKEGEVLHIEGKTDTCFDGEPFEIHYPNNGLRPGPPICPTPTDWFYKVWLTKDGETIAIVDPEVIIRGGG